MINILMSWDGAWFGLLIGALIIGILIGYFVARFLMKKQIKENPPINENMIRAMYMQMGRKPSESQIKAVMNSIKRENKK